MGKEVESQAFLYTSRCAGNDCCHDGGKGTWKKPGVFNLEEMDPIHTWRLLISSDCLAVVENPVPVDCYKTEGMSQYIWISPEAGMK